MPFWLQAHWLFDIWLAMSFRLVTEGSILLLVLTSLLAIQGCGSGDSTEEEAQELSESMSEADTSPPPLRAITTSAPTADAPLPDLADTVLVDYGDLNFSKGSGVVAGRPYLVGGVEVLAKEGDRVESEWRHPHISAVPDREDEWFRIGVAEHASVASFSRATLQLMAHGAPSSLVDETLSAARDEVRHARVAFALAGRSPGALPLGVDTEPLHLPLAELGRRVYAEGCLGETRAVLRAVDLWREAAPGAEKDFWAMVLRDERRHAELAWRTLRWVQQREDVALRDGPGDSDVIAGLVAALEAPDFDARLQKAFDLALPEL